MDYCNNCGEPIVRGERFCANCGSRIISGDYNDNKESVRGYFEGENISHVLFDKFGSLNGTENNSKFKNISSSNRKIVQTKLSNEVIVDNKFINELTPLDESEVYSKDRDEDDGYTIFLDTKDAHSNSKSQISEKRTWELTLVLGLNYGFIGLVGLLAIYIIPMNVLVSILLFIAIGYAILLVKSVQDYNDTTRIILSIIVLLEIVLSVDLFSIYIFIIALFQVYVLMFHKGTIKLYAKIS